MLPVCYIGYIVRNVKTWCGKKEGPGMDFVSCPSRGKCGDKFGASESFWKALSADVRMPRFLV